MRDLSPPSPPPRRLTAVSFAAGVPTSLLPPSFFSQAQGPVRFDQFMGSDAGAFGSDAYDEEDREADKIWAAVDGEWAPPSLSPCRSFRP